MGLLCSQTGPSGPAVVLGVLVFALTLGALVVLLFVDGDWSAWSQATCLSAPLGCFCEYARPTLVRQPSNTFSNLAFTIVGIVVLVESIQQQIAAAGRREKLSQEQALGRAFACSYAVSQVVLGAGSAWYHASLTFHGQWIDNAAMYLTVSAPMLYARASVRLSAKVAHGKSPQNSARLYLIEFIAVNVVLGVLCLVLPVTRRYIFMILIVGLLAYEMWARRVLPARARKARLNPLGVALATFLVAFVIWTLDIRHILCKPESLLQGHALWHILNAVATFQIYMYYHPIVHPTLPLRV